MSVNEFRESLFWKSTYGKCVNNVEQDWKTVSNANAQMRKLSILTEEGCSCTTDIEVLMIRLIVCPRRGESSVCCKHKRAQKRTPDKHSAPRHTVLKSHGCPGNQGITAGSDEVHVKLHLLVESQCLVNG